MKEIDKCYYMGDKLLYNYIIEKCGASEEETEVSLIICYKSFPSRYNLKSSHITIDDYNNVILVMVNVDGIEFNTIINDVDNWFIEQIDKKK